MKLLLLLTVFLSVYPASSEVSEKSCEKEKSHNASNTADNYGKLSTIYELVNIATGIDFETARCKEELMVIKEGLRKKDVWAFKRE